MNRATPFAALAVLCLAAAARAEEPAPPTGQLADGAVLEIAVQDSLASLGTGSGSSGILLGAPSGRFFVGRKVGRLVVGAGLELTRVGFSSSGSTSSSSSSQTQLSFVPGLRYAMATSADQRVELLGLVNLGIGHTFTSTSSGSSSPGGNYRLLYEVGPALRFWVHPQFALGANAGVRGDHLFVDIGTGSSSSSVGVTSLFTGLDLLGVF
jgi:hypothetical protein